MTKYLLNNLNNLAFGIGVVLTCIFILVLILKQIRISIRQKGLYKAESPVLTHQGNITKQNDPPVVAAEDDIPEESMQIIAKRIILSENMPVWHRIGREEQTYSRL